VQKAYAFAGAAGVRMKAGAGVDAALLLLLALALAVQYALLELAASLLASSLAAISTRRPPKAPLKPSSSLMLLLSLSLSLLAPPQPSGHEANAGAHSSSPRPVRLLSPPPLGLPLPLRILPMMLPPPAGFSKATRYTSASDRAKCTEQKSSMALGGQRKEAASPVLRGLHPGDDSHGGGSDAASSSFDIPLTGKNSLESCCGTKPFLLRD
jgi:hypothetical protein